MAESAIPVDVQMAQEALVTAPGQAVNQPTFHGRSRGSEDVKEGGGLGFTETSVLHLPGVRAEVHDMDDEDIGDNDVVYLTKSYLEWECHYLRRLGKRIHRMVCAELDRTEEALFMLYAAFDKNLDGVVREEEVDEFIEALESAVPAVGEDDTDLVDEDGSVSFIALLEWYKGVDGTLRDTHIAFNMTSLTVGLMGSGMLSADARLEALDWASLRQNVLGYRRLLTQVRQLKEERLLAPARELENTQGLEAAMPAYYSVLRDEFEGDAEHLFELLSDVDLSGNLMLETGEVEALLQRLDTGASSEDLTRYIAEMNLADGPLSFASLVDWWDEARSVSNSLVAEKGPTLIAGVKARATQGKVTGMFMETAVQRRWREANDTDRLQALRQAYRRTFGELREYKMERDLRFAEQECARL